MFYSKQQTLFQRLNLSERFNPLRALVTLTIFGACVVILSAPTRESISSRRRMANNYTTNYESYGTKSEMAPVRMKKVKKIEQKWSSGSSWRNAVCAFKKDILRRNELNFEFLNMETYWLLNEELKEVLPEITSDDLGIITRVLKRIDEDYEPTMVNIRFALMEHQDPSKNDLKRLSCLYELRDCLKRYSNSHQLTRKSSSKEQKACKIIIADWVSLSFRHEKFGTDWGRAKIQAPVIQQDNTPGTDAKSEGELYAENKLKGDGFDNSWCVECQTWSLTSGYTFLTLKCSSARCPLTLPSRIKTVGQNCSDEACRGLIKEICSSMHSVRVHDVCYDKLKKNVEATSFPALRTIFKKAERVLHLY